MKAIASRKITTASAEPYPRFTSVDPTWSCYVLSSWVVLYGPPRVIAQTMSNVLSEWIAGDGEDDRVHVLQLRHDDVAEPLPLVRAVDGCGLLQCGVATLPRPAR